jgi:hypothetical protein
MTACIHAARKVRVVVHVAVELGTHQLDVTQLGADMATWCQTTSRQ